MHTKYIDRIQIILNSGLMVAEIPESLDPTMAQLSGGITSAILTMVKEVHKTELDSISFHDRSVIFIPLDELIFVLEINTLLSNEIMDKIKHEFIDNIDFSADILYSGKSVDVVKSKKVLQTIYDSEWLHNIFTKLGYSNTLETAEISSNEAQYKDGQFEMLTSAGDDEVNKIACELVENFIQVNEYKNPFYCGFINSDKLDRAMFMISIKNGDIYRNGALTTSSADAKQLFRQSSNLRDEFIRIMENNPDCEVNEIMDILNNTHDFSEREFSSSKYNVQISELERYVKDVDKFLFAAIVGEPIVMYGKKEDIEAISSILTSFINHQNYSIIEWLEGDKIGSHISGMSEKKYQELQKLDAIPDTVVVLNIKSRKLSGPLRSNKFVKNLYQRNKSFSLRNARENIMREMELIVSYAINYTSYTRYQRGELLKKLGDLKSNIANNAQFELIQEIATRQNTWLNQIIKEDTDISEDWI